MSNKTEIQLKTSPHVIEGDSVPSIMLNVVLATAPLCGFMVYQFGLSALTLLVVVCAACMGTEYLFARLNGQPSPLGDYSALITGMLLTLTLPPSLPLWVGVVAGVSGIGLAKVMFGGIGSNVFNPALVGRAFVQAAFPVAVNTWPPAFFEGRFTSFIPSTFTAPFMTAPELMGWSQSVAPDAYAGATTLALQKFQGIHVPASELLYGISSPAMTGAPALLVVVCGLYLVARGMMDWRIPVSVMAGAALLSGGLHLMDAQYYPDPLFELASGGLMLGAWFMASDMVGSPVTKLGTIVYGLLIGVVTIVIRRFGGMADTVMYAILLGNASTPLIEYVTQPRVFGWKRKTTRTAAK
jgi:electron transport complex protein RnfD